MGIVGSCNGAIGQVNNWIYKENVIPPSLSTAVLAKFGNYNGSIFYNINLVPICPLNTSLYE